MNRLERLRRALNHRPHGSLSPTVFIGADDLTALLDLAEAAGEYIEVNDTGRIAAYQYDKLQAALARLQAASGEGVTP